MLSQAAVSLNCDSERIVARRGKGHPAPGEHGNSGTAGRGKSGTAGDIFRHGKSPS